MRKARLELLILILAIAVTRSLSVCAQSFGGAFQRKKIVLVRKLPPTGHIDGSSFTVNVAGPGIQPDVLANLKSTIESLIVSSDPRLRTVAPTEHPDAVINCQVTSFATPPAQVVSQPGFSFSKKPAPAEQLTHITGVITATFNAQNLTARRSIAANTETARFDQEYPVPPPASAAAKPSFTSLLAAHIPKMPSSTQNPTQSQDADKPPSPVELKDLLIQTMAVDIASNLVNTSEQVPVDLAIGPGLDEANKLMDQKLWTRALEQLESMTPFPQPEQDAYRTYEIGVVNEALGYNAEDFTSARKYLQEAAIDYGKAIDAKPTEKEFLQPQTRIDTALAHYKTLGDQMTAATQSAAVAAAPPSDSLTNADVIAMVSAKLDEANIIDTIKTASAVNFDLTAHGQIDLAKGNVNGRIIAAMKQKARAQ